MALQLPSGGGSLPSLPHAVALEFESKYPLLAEWFTASSFGDGTLKKAGVIQIRISFGVFLAQLQLPGTGLRLHTQIPDPLLAYDALEALLSTSPIPFERDPFARDTAAAEDQKKKKK